jgi:small subunit ribosomal protein S8
MSMTDPLGDMLTRIRNGQQAKKDSILTPASKLRARVLDVLQREGYIRGYSEADVGTATAALRIDLKYFEGKPAIQHIARVSKPGRRVYSGATELPRIRNGLGIVIVSTPKGVLSDAEAREQNAGGEVLCQVF